MRFQYLRLLLPVMVVLMSSGPVSAANSTLDVEYARVGEQVLKLDLHLPDTPNPQLLIYVHGGAWRSGSKESVPVASLLDHGFAIASVDYRLSTQAPFPAQVHDLKAAIRFLRAKSALFHIDTTRMGIVGTSAGGHLAALVGVTNGNANLEGKVGEHLRQSSDVQCIVSLFGASNLQSILSQSTEFGLRMRVPALELLLRGQPDEKAALAKLASPVSHLDRDDPPLLLIHGDADPQMPPEQSQEFAKAYEAMKLRVRLVTIKGGLHGGRDFFDSERMGIIATFLQDHLQQP